MQPQLKKTLWIVVPSILFLLVVLAISIIYSINDKGPATSAATPATVNAIRFPDQDFAYVTPTDPWQPIDGTKIVPTAVLGFGRTNPNMKFVAMVTNLPAALTLEQLAGEIMKEIHGSFDAMNLVITQQPAAKTINNVPGVAVIHRADTGGVPQTYVHWVGMQHGKAYHLLLFGLSSDENAVIGEAENMLGRFHPLSDFPAASAPPGSLPDFTSPRYQYVVHFKDPNWRQWPDFHSQADYAELGVLNGNDTGMTTSAVNIGNMSEDFDTLLVSYARGVGANITADNTQRMRSATGEGALFTYITPVTNGSGAVQHIYELIRIKGMLFIAHAWTMNGQKLPMLLEQLRTYISFPGEPPATVEMSPGEQRLFGSLLNEVGITYVRSNRPGQAIQMLEQAQKLLPDMPTIADNKAIAQLQANQPRDARNTINAAMQQFPNDPAVKARAAQIDAELGDNKTAQDLYASIVSKSDFHTLPGSDGVIIQYAKFLLQQNLFDKAKEVVGTYRSGSDASRGISILYAMVLGRNGEHAAAVDLLEQLRKTSPTTSQASVSTTMPSTAPTTLSSASPDAEPDLLIVLGKEYNAVGRFSEALEIADDLIKRGIDTVDSYLIKAGALAGTKKFADARSAVETALQRNALNRECFDMQRSIAQGLGQDDKSLYTKPIDAVALPQEALQAIPADPPASTVTDAMGAYYIARIGAIAFDGGKEFRSTELQRIKALTRTGGERVSSFEFRFDPTVESIYINKAEVKDASGNVVSTVKPEDAFLIDAPSSDTSLQRKILRLGVTGFAPDCTLDVLVTRKMLAPPARMKFTRYFLSTPVLVQRAAFVLRTPDMSQVKDTASAGIDKKTYGDALCWQLDNPPIYRAEPIQQESSIWLPWVAVGDSKATWDQVGDEYLASLKAVLADDAACKTLATRLISGKTSEQDKLVAIAAYVQKEIANKYSDFATNGRVPRKAADVLLDKSGDAKDQALLFYQLLHAAGFDGARLALVNRSDKIDSDLPSVEQFDHMVVCLPSSSGGAPRFIDCTEKELSVESPTDTFVANKALVLQSGGSQLIDVPPLPADASTIKVKRDITMDSHAVLTVHDVMELNGPAASLWRSPLKTLSADDQKKQVRDVIARAGFTADITQLNISPLDDPQKPLVVDITYTLAGRFRQGQNGIVVGQLPATWELHWLIPPQATQRLSPFYLRVPMKIQSEFALHLFEKVKLANTPPDDKVDGTFGTLKSTYSSKPGELDGTIEIHTTAGRFEKDAYNKDFVPNRITLINKSQPELDLQVTQ